MKKTLLALAITTLAATAVQAQTSIFSDNFNYANGSLITVSNGVWATHSGTAGQVDVANNLVNITQSESEDVNAQIGGQIYTTGTLIATLDVNFSALPSATTPTYFTHFKDATASGFRGRVFADQTGAAANSFRLGIANTTAAFVNVPLDLALGTTYTLTLSLDVASGVASLAVNGSPAVVATDAATPLAISTYAFRQSAGEGTLTADSLAVSYTAAAVPEPATYAYVIAGLGALVLGMRRRSAA